MPPTLTLRGPRLRLRPWRDDDLEDAMAWSNDRVSLRFAGVERRDKPYRPYSVAEIETIYRAASLGGWVFIALLGNRRVGEFSLSLNGPEPGSARIDFVVAPAFRGRGLGREGVAICADFAFNVLKVPALYGYVGRGNVASRRLHRSLGYRRRRQEERQPFVLANTTANSIRVRKLLTLT
ncbi:MAG TPA: GNAT family N-acetyltransferase [Dehalococcoidia bacterium]|nr:GNAT family N-acetyltransferase [Dehalococcoidia bacterium]